jgi:hypothetical protein
MEKIIVVGGTFFGRDDDLSLALRVYSHPFLLPPHTQYYLYNNQHHIWRHFYCWSSVVCTGKAFCASDTVIFTPSCWRTYSNRPITAKSRVILHRPTGNTVDTQVTVVPCLSRLLVLPDLIDLGAPPTLVRSWLEMRRLSLASCHALPFSTALCLAEMHYLQ